MEQNLRILIVATDPLVRAGLSSLLEGISDCQVIGLANPAELLPDLATNIEDSEAELLIWDWGLDVGDPMSFDFHDIDTPVITLLADAIQADDAWTSGSKALIFRDASPEEVLATATAVTHGFHVIDPKIAAKILPSNSYQKGDLDILPTPREQQVLQLLAEGLTNRAIAQELNISQHTAKFHVNSILNKLNVQSRTEAVVQATRLGLIAL